MAVASQAGAPFSRYGASQMNCHTIAAFCRGSSTDGSVIGASGGANLISLSLIASGSDRVCTSGWESDQSSSNSVRYSVFLSGSSQELETSSRS